MNYKITIAYEGTRYHGWQIQPNGVSIQELIEKALKVVLKEKIKVIGSGRTDAGVHAMGQTAHFKTDILFDLPKLHRSLNAILPHDIRILSLGKAADDFHAQYSVKSKVYRYNLYLDQVLDPFQRLFVWHYPYPFNQEKFQEAAKFFIGKHDFSSFANEAHQGVAAFDPVRHLARLDVISTPHGLTVEFEADGFLYKMVRNIVGTLVDCASNKISPQDIQAIIAAKDRKKAGQAAPPQGLFLYQVFY